MRGERVRRSRIEEEERERTAMAPAHPALALQAAFGNAAVTRMLAREVTTSDRTAMSMKPWSWGKTDVERKQYLESLPPADAAAKIDEFCRERANKVKKDPPTFDEVVEALDLNARKIKKPKVEAKEVEGMDFDMLLLKRGKTSVGLDEHQNKHQFPQLNSLKAYKGEKARSRYGATATIDWHRTTTAPIVLGWVNKLNREKKLDPPGTNVMSATGEELGTGHLFVAVAMKDSKGNLYGSYHCYPA
jgi:hypothetical protein